MYWPNNVAHRTLHIFIYSGEVMIHRLPSPDLAFSHIATKHLVSDFDLGFSIKINQSIFS